MTPSWCARRLEDAVQLADGVEARGDAVEQMTHFGIAVGFGSLFFTEDGLHPHMPISRVRLLAIR